MRAARAVLAVALSAASLAFLVALVAGQGPDFLAALARLSPLPFALGAALAFVQTLVAAQLWRDLLSLLGPRASWSEAYRVLSIGGLARYVPGRVWAVAGVGLWSERLGIPPGAAASAALATVAVTGAAGAVLALLAYLLAGRVDPRALGLLGLLLALTPAAGSLLVSGRARAPLRAAAAAVGCWLLVGASQTAIAASLDPAAPSLAPTIFLSAALAWLAGLVGLLPAGLGLREAAQVAVLAPLLPTGVAAAVALLVRAALVLADLAALLVAVALAPRLRASLRPH